MSALETRCAQRRLRCLGVYNTSVLRSDAGGAVGPRQRRPSAVGCLRRDRVEPDPPSSASGWRMWAFGFGNVGDVNLGAASLSAQNLGLSGIGTGNLGFAQRRPRQYRFQQFRV